MGRRISITFKSSVSSTIVNEIRTRYADFLIDDDALYDWFQTDLHNKINANLKAGEWLSGLRESHGITQEELGRKIGTVSGARISDWEKGRRAIRKSAALKFSQYFNVPVEKFLLGDR